MVKPRYGIKVSILILVGAIENTAASHMPGLTPVTFYTGSLAILDEKCWILAIRYSKRSLVPRLLRDLVILYKGAGLG